MQKQAPVRGVKRGSINMTTPNFVLNAVLNALVANLLYLVIISVHRMVVHLRAGTIGVRGGV